MNVWSTIPPPVLTDSYKLAHSVLYPDAEKMVAYGEFRKSFAKDTHDQRMVYYGIRYIIENHIARRWTMEDVQRAEAFFNTHNSGDTAFPFPKELFIKIVEEHNGYFPAKIESLPEGTVVYPHVPVYQITTYDEFSPLVTYLETLLVMVWYPSTVATLSRRVRDVVKRAFDSSVDSDNYFLLDSRLHDFGFRGCTSVEQSVIGGCAHLLNFNGTDTLSAAYYAQFHLNDGEPVGTSIPATEHSVMTSYHHELDAILAVIDKFGAGTFACVMDSYDYRYAMEKLLPAVKSQKLAKGGFMVLRPDSGDPVEVVLMGLRAADKVFGSKVNNKGFKVLQGCGIIQGDGVDYHTIGTILDAVLRAGYSAQNVAFGMGGGLLQRVNRDTMNFANKLSCVVYRNGEHRDVMKYPKTDASKLSLPGELEVCNSQANLPMVYPRPSTTEQRGTPQFQVIYDHGPVSGVWDKFSTIQGRLRQQWNNSPLKHNPISAELQAKIDYTVAELRASIVDRQN
ncbi:hypothetical protein IWQ61_006346 [Dispira simplex]|nr:hypothetical protein IWQ61_006346 [Dispira simplex]